MNEYDTFNWGDFLMSPTELANAVNGLTLSYEGKDAVTLSAETTVDMNQMYNVSSADMDRTIRRELVEQLVNQILNEDLITIETSTSGIDPLHQNQTFRAKLKILQER